MESRYQYMPLERGQIRLISLLPGRWSEDIRLRFVTTAKDGRFVSQAQWPDYEALSYTWGDPCNRSNIFVVPEYNDNWAAELPASASRVSGKSIKSIFRKPSGNNIRSKGGYLSVTRNAYEALLHLRLAEAERTLWIDAICINQDDLDERGSQVRKMRRIYKMATQVVIWLGPEENDSTFALEFLAEWGAKIKVNWKSLMISVDETDEANIWMSDMEDSPEKRKIDRKPPSWPRSFDAIFTLLARPWFERLWIIQEVALARKAVLRAGATELSWSLFRDAVFGFGQKGVDHSDGSVEFERQRICNRLEELFNMTMNCPSSTRLLHIARSCQCSDQRDKVYATLGMAQEQGFTSGYKLIPDYTKSVAEVYLDACIHSLDSNLEFLEHCRITPGIRWRPTWVPDWSVPCKDTPLFQSYADAESLPEARYMGGGTLKVAGLIVASIHKATVFGFKDLDLLTGQDLFAEIKRVIPRRPVLQAGDTYEDYYSRVCDCLCSGTFQEWNIPPNTLYPKLHLLPQALQLGLDDTDDDSSITLILAFLERRGLGEAESIDFVNNFLKLCKTAMKYGQERSFVECDDGHVSIAPSETRTGDALAVILGCRQILTLRPSAGGRYEVIGPAHVPGCNYGESLLGRLPTGVKHARVVSDDGISRVSFQSPQSEEWTTLDPRVRWEEVKKRTNPRGIPGLLDAQYFRKHGVQLETLELV